MKNQTNPLSLPVLLAAALAIAGGATRAVPPKSDDLAAEKTAAPVKLSTRLDRPLIHRPGGEQEVVIQIGVEGLRLEKPRRQPLNLAVVLDHSGSMTGRKLEQAKQAAQMLVDQLDRDDIFSLVIYDTEVEVVIPAQPVRDHRADFKRRIERVQPAGSTALFAGVETGGRQLAEFFDRERVNRVILLSDGLANVGPKSNREIAQLGRKLADDGMSVSTIGLGDDYNEDLMTALAEASDANYYYVADVEELPGVFEREIGELQAIVARDIVIEIRFPDGVRPLSILGRSGDSVEGQSARLAFGTLSSEQNREILVSCAVDPARFGDDRSASLAGIDLAWKSADGQTRNLSQAVMAGFTKDEKLAEKSRDLAVATQAEIYRNAEATERAIAFADAGKTEEAKAAIGGQIDRLRAAQSAAPAPQQESLEREIRVLEENQDRIGEDKASRKALQWNVFTRKNSKSTD